jgi:hypothetical protein
MVFGFPSGKDMAEMFGYVTEEDRSKWEQQREASKKESPGTAQDMASKSIAPALDMAKRGVQAQMHGAQYEAQRGAQPKQRSRVIRQTVTEQSRNVDSVDDAGYDPEF